MEHDQSVDYYAEGLVKLRIWFPHGRVDCRHCRFCRYRDAFGIFQCALTDVFVEKAELDDRAQFCPIEIQDTPF